jgi:hypothetical protein
MNRDFSKRCGKFEVEGWYEGHPHWHFIKCVEGDSIVQLRHLQIEDLHDLAYVVSRAIEHHSIHGYKPRQE